MWFCPAWVALIQVVSRLLWRRVRSWIPTTIQSMIRVHTWILNSGCVYTRSMEYMGTPSFNVQVHFIVVKIINRGFDKTKLFKLLIVVEDF